MEPAVQEIVDLTQAFAAGQVPAPEFDATMRDLFSRLPVVDEETFAALEDLAYSCSDYVEDPALRDEPGDLDEAGLLEAARTALIRLGVS